MALRAVPLRESGCGEMIVSFERLDGHVSGTMTHRCSERSFHFNSELEFIDIAEAIADIMLFPLSVESYRSFAKNKRIQTTADDWSAIDMFKIDAPGATEKPTFVIKIEQRQNATWQGSIRWLETGEIRNFRSVMELFRLMDTAFPEEEN